MTPRVLAALLLVTACGDAVTPRPPVVGGTEPALRDAGPAQTLFGPERFTRLTGAPTRFTRTVATGALSAPFVLHVRNGAANGSSRLSSARVSFGGIEVLGPKDFGQAQAAWDIPVPLAASATLVVELMSKPGSYLDIWITGAPTFVFATVFSDDVWKLNTIDIATQSVIATLDASLGAGPAVTPDGQFVYVSGDPTKVVATATNTVVASISGVGTDAWISTITPNGAYVYIANHNSANVTAISTATNSVIATIPVGEGPFGVAATPNSAFVYVMNTRSSSVSVISTATNTVVATIPTEAQPTSVVISPDGARAYVGHGTPSNLVTVISTATNTVVETIGVGSNNVAIAITPDGSRLYVANERLGTVSVIETATSSVVASIPVGQNPISVAITPDGAYCYVTNFNSPFISVIGTATNTVVASVPTGGKGGWLAIRR